MRVAGVVVIGCAGASGEQVLGLIVSLYQPTLKKSDRLV
jgi:hypothetical protein